MVSVVSRVNRYRDRARELRAVAETTKNAEAKEIILRLAKDYVHMANAIESREQARAS